MQLGFSKITTPTTTSRNVSRQITALPNVSLGTNRRFYFRDGTFVVPDGIFQVRLSGYNYNSYDSTTYNMYFTLAVFPGESLDIKVKGTKIGVLRGTDVIAGMDEADVINGVATEGELATVGGILSLIEW